MFRIIESHRGYGGDLPSHLVLGENLPWSGLLTPDLTALSPKFLYIRPPRWLNHMICSIVMTTYHKLKHKSNRKMKRNRIRNIRHCFLGAIYLLSNWDFKPRLKKKTAIRRRYSCPSDWRLSTSCGFNWGPLKPLDYHSIIVLLRGLRRPLIGPHYTERR